MIFALANTTNQPTSSLNNPAAFKICSKCSRTYVLPAFPPAVSRGEDSSISLVSIKGAHYGSEQWPPRDCINQCRNGDKSLSTPPLRLASKLPKDKEETASVFLNESTRAVEVSRTTERDQLPDAPLHSHILNPRFLTEHCA